MRALRSILVVVDPTAATHPCVEKAARLAHLTGAELELFLCDFSDALLPSYLDKLETPEEAAQVIRVARERLLDDLAAPLRRAGLKLRINVLLERPLQAGILRRIRATQPDLVLKDTHFHSLIGRALITNTDWHLIRESPAPLLFVRSRAWPAEGLRIAAALDPAHPDDEPDEVDHEILATAAYLQSRAGGELLGVHAVDTLRNLQAAAGARDPAGLAGGGLAARIVEEIHAGHRRRLVDLLAAHGLQGIDLAVVEGSAADVLPGFAANRNVDILVMGAVARGGLARILVGSTAERVLDRLPCDVLVVRTGRLAQQLSAA